MYPRLLQPLFVLLALVPSLVWGTNLARPLEEVRVQLRWTHQFQFAGYYAAIEKGFYHDEGLDVTLLEADADTHVSQVVADGRAEYGVGDSGLLISRREGQPLVLLAQIIQHSPMVFIARADSGIVSPYEMRGKRVMFDRLGDSNSPLVATLIDTLGSLDEVETLTPTNSRLDDLLSGKVDVMAGYSSNEPYELQRHGVPINIIRPQSYGIDFYGDNLFTTADEVRDHAQRVDGMIRATLKGWRYALDHRAEMIQLIRAKYNPSLTLERLEYEAATIEKLLLADSVELGSINPEHLASIGRIYERLGFLDSPEIPPGFIYLARPRPLITLTPEEHRWLAKNPVIRVASATNWAPIAFTNARQEHQGLAMDYLRAMEDFLGIRFDVQADIGSHQEALERMNRDQLDMFSALSKTNSHASNLLFSKHYFTMPAIIFGNQGMGYITNLDDLRGKRIAVVENDALHDWLQSRYLNLQLIPQPDTATAMAQLADHQADFVIAGAFTAAHCARELGHTHIRIAGETPFTYHISFAVRKDWPILAGILDKAQETIQFQQKEQITRRWINVDLQQGIDPHRVIHWFALLLGGVLVLVAVFFFWVSRLRGEIAARKLSEQALLDNKRLLRNIVDNVDALIFLKDLKGRYILVNRAFGDLLKRTPEACINDTDESLFGEVIAQHLAQAEQQLLSSHQASSFTESTLTIDNRRYVFIIAKSLLFNSFGEPTAICGIATDITEHTQLEKRLFDNQNRLQLALEAAQAGTFHYRASTDLVEWDRRGLDILGLTPCGFDGSFDAWFALIHPHDLPRIRQSLERLRNGTSESIDAEYRIDGEGDEQRHVHTLASVRRHADGRIDRISGLIFDITNDKMAKTRLQEAKERAEAAANELRREKSKAQQYIDTVEAIIIALDQHGHITLINRKGCQILGYPAEELLGRYWLDVCLPKGDDGVEVLDALDKVLGGQLDEVEYLEHQIVTRSGERRIIAWHNTCILENERIVGSLSAGEDITERKKAEAALITAKDEAEAANRAKSTFLANMSHEIRTPMNAILGFSSLLRAKIVDPEVAGNLDAISKAGKNLLQLINDILDLSRVEAGKLQLLPTPVDIRALVGEAEQIFSLRLQSKKLALHIWVADDIPRSLLIDEVRIRQILLNLVGNAIKFTEQGEIRLNVETTAPPPSNPSYINLQITVSDTGRGIAPGVLGRIFGSFEQQESDDSRRQDGAGLGLAICQRLVEIMHGEIRAESEQGKGSRFIVTLPEVPVTQDTSQPLGGDDRHQTIRFDPANVLVVDDIESNRILVEAFLADSGLETHFGVNGRDGLEKARALHPEVVLMDLRMPEMDGEEALKQMKADLELCDIPVIALTASVIHNDSEQLKQQGFHDVLYKPVQQSDLLQALAHLLPHCLVDQDHWQSASGIQLGPEQLSGLVELFPSLEEKYLDWWKRVELGCSFPEIERFALTLKLDAEQANATPLVRYAENLLNCAASFDVLNIKAQLALYPRMLEQLKSQLKGQHPGT